MNKTAANASVYIACKGIYESKTDYNCRSTKLGENDGKTLFDDKRQHKKNITTYLFSAKKSRSVGSTWKRSKEEATYNSPDVK